MVWPARPLDDYLGELRAHGYTVVDGLIDEAALERIGVDPDVASTLQSDLLASGVDIFLDAEVDEFVKPDDAGVDLGESRAPMKISIKKSSTKEKAHEIEAEVLMTATGRTANTKGLGLEEAGVELDRGKIKVNGCMETSVPGVYAVGDVVGAPGCYNKK